MTRRPLTQDEQDDITDAAAEILDAVGNMPPNLALAAIGCAATTCFLAWELKPQNKLRAMTAWLHSVETDVKDEMP